MMGHIEGINVPWQSFLKSPPYSGEKAPERLSCLVWEAVIEKRRSSANRIH